MRIKFFLLFPYPLYIIKASSLGIGPYLERAVAACAAPCGEFPYFGSEVIIDMRLVSIESRTLANVRGTTGAESVVGQFESNDRTLEVLVVTLGTGVLTYRLLLVGS